MPGQCPDYSKERKNSGNRAVYNGAHKILDGFGTISDRKNTIKPIKQSEESTLFCMHPAVQPECMNQNKPRVARIFHFLTFVIKQNTKVM